MTAEVVGGNNPGLGLTEGEANAIYGLYLSCVYLFALPGGWIENRARLMLEVTDAVIDVWGADRVGMHIAPRGDAQSMGDSNPAAIFGYLVRELDKRKIAFICAREHQGDDSLSPRRQAGLQYRQQDRL